MKLKYGSYTHGAGECVVAIEKTAEMAGDATKWIRERWNITGEIHGSDVADLTAKIQALETAYAVGGKDIRILTDAGVNTAHVMQNSSTVKGTRIVQHPSFPRGEGAEYATYRTFSLAVEGERPASGATLMEYRESVSYAGTCEMTWKYQTPLYTEPQRQQLTAYSVQQIVQEGYAAGLNAYPAYPGPLFPDDEHLEQRMIRLEFPVKGSTERRTSWRYVFSSHLPLTGYPHQA